MDLKLVGDRYEILSLIGEGGMASVYSALDRKLDRKVAVKVLHSHLAKRREIRERFHQEAKSISSIDHPNILKIFDFSGDKSALLWIVTEILYGVNLGIYCKKFRHERLHPIIASLVARELCHALEEVHNHQIVHRDIKPENVMVLDSGVIKLMDFGIAKVASTTSATQTGTFMGSPSYMSPEQIQGAKIDARSDIYSFSVLFYEIMTGTMPFEGQTAGELINKILTGTLIPPRKAFKPIPEELNQLIMRNLSRDPNKRYRNILSYGRALDGFLYGVGIKDSSKALKKFFKDPQKFTSVVAKMSRSRSSSSNPRTPRSFDGSSTSSWASKPSSTTSTGGGSFSRFIVRSLLITSVLLGLIFVFLPSQKIENLPKIPIQIPTVKNPGRHPDPPKPHKVSKTKPRRTVVEAKAPKNGPGILRISSLPAAMIYVNNQRFGTTNDRNIIRRGIRLDPGTYVLTLTRNGYHNKSIEVEITPQDTQSIKVELEKIPHTLLKLLSNKAPTGFEIKELKSDKVVKSFTLDKSRSRINLPHGSYKVTARYQDALIERVLHLNTSNSVSFNAQFP